MRSQKILIIIFTSLVLFLYTGISLAISICDVSQNDNNGVPLLLNSTVTIRGIITASDQFYAPAFIQDTICGVAVYDHNFGTKVSIGDDVTLTATVTQYKGLTELTNVSSYIVHSSNNITSPKVVTCRDISTDGANGVEKYEGLLVRINNVTVNTNRWTVSGSGRNYTLTDSTGTCQIRIDGDANLANTEAPLGNFDVIGVISQYDPSSPYTSGYQIMPRFIDDIIEKGIGVATIEPQTVTLATSGITETVTITHDSIGIILNQIEVDIPSGWIWETPGPMGIDLSGAGFPDTAHMDTSQSNDSTIIVKGASISNMVSGVIQILNLTSPNYPGRNVFHIKTAYDNQKLTRIESSPFVYIKPSEKTALTVPPHPFAPDLGERLKIMFSAPPGNHMVLKLFDLEGRVVVTLFDGESSGGMEINNWDGRNELFERVPIGVYILYLEATDAKTGETTTAKAPVVVATRLD